MSSSSCALQLSEVLECILTVGATTGRIPSAVASVQQLRQRLRSLASSVLLHTPSLSSPFPRPHVLFLTSLNPLQAGGFWLPEMIQLAGGQDPALVETGCPAKTISWEVVTMFAPQVLLLSPCCQTLKEAAVQVRGQGFFQSCQWQLLQKCHRRPGFPESSREGNRVIPSYPGICVWLSSHTHLLGSASMTCH